MKNIEYWRDSLSNVLEKEIVTDRLIEKIIGISEMEYEYTSFESHRPSTKETNPLEKTVSRLEKENRVLSEYIAKLKGVDCVSVEDNRVSLFDFPR